MLYSKQYMDDLLSCLSPELSERLRNKVFAITGASGLICSYITDALLAVNAKTDLNISVYAFGRNIEALKNRFEIHKNNPALHLVEYDVFAPFPALNADFIIHGASPAYPGAFVSDPVGTMNSNYLGMLHILEAAKNTNSRVLFISSSEIYGAGDDKKIWIENNSGSVDTMNYRSCYPSSKRATETLCAAYKEQFGVDCVVARPCHIYGPTMTPNDNRAISAFIRNAVRTEPVIMKSKGTALRSYCYAGDCCRAIITILLSGNSGEAYNISNKYSIVTVRELAELVSSISGAGIVTDIPKGQKTGFNPVDKIIMSSDKLEGLGWTAQTDLRAGLVETISILNAEFRIGGGGGGGVNDLIDKDSLSRIHKMGLEMLDEVVRICGENNLGYFLTGGTLLGAVRHKGFIPWDDDIDIGMLRKDYDIFIKKCKKQLNQKYYLQASETSKYCKYSHAKIRMNNTLYISKNFYHDNDHRGIFLDIFPYDYVLNSKSLIKLQRFILDKIDNIVSIKRNDIIAKKCLYTSIKRFIFRFIPFCFLHFLRRCIMFVWKKNGSHITQWWGIYGYEKETHPADAFLPVTTLNFEGRSCTVPGNWDAYLRRLYGDYMQLPPIEDRRTHEPIIINFDTSRRKQNDA